MNQARISELQAIVDDFTRERNWERFHRPKSLAMSIAIEAAELMEHFQWTDNVAPTEKLSADSPIAEEMADVFAYLLRMATILGVDLDQAVRLKMIKNAEKYPASPNCKPSSSGF